MDNLDLEIHRLYPDYGTDVGHGHLWKRPDKFTMRCGGVGHCSKCAGWAAKLQAARDTLAERLKPAAPQTDVAHLDTTRLNFLDRAHALLNRQTGTDYTWQLIMNQNVNRLVTEHFAIDLNDIAVGGGKSCRDAIDAKMRDIDQHLKARNVKDDDL